MALTFDEILRYSKRKIEDVFDEKGNIKDEYKSLMEKIIPLLNSNPELNNLITELSNTSDYIRINELRNKYEESDKEVSKEEEISRIYGISLESIEHVSLKNGKEFYKFYDSRLDKDIMLKRNDEHHNLSEEFKGVQENLDSAKGSNSKENAEEVFKYQRTHTYNELNLYPVYQLENNPSLLAGLNNEQLEALSLLMKNKDTLHIVSINPENGIAIDNEHKIITIELDKEKNSYEFNYPKQYKYDNDVVSNANATQSANEELEEVEVADDIPKEIDGITIDPEHVKLYYDYPEILEKDQTLSEKHRNVYREAVRRYSLIFKRKNKDKPKVLVKHKKDNKNGYIDLLLLAGTTGFFGGVFTTIMYNIIK